ncbi:MAG TPA: hypothetical protein VF490_14960 [Chryseosolibacter sp.]
MKEVYYKGQPYHFKIVEVGGTRHFQLFENGILKHTVEQSDLDIRSIVSFILDSYYREALPKENTAVLNQEATVE